ncbi:MAG: PLP-dependent aminotransferase family protein, partial [Myxococcales bacterium]|nr:PLP-dependent aminotransferase family protein [Myxococcales bacterium]
VEGLGYRPAWEALRATGAQLVPVPVDEHGLQVDRLAALAERVPLRALYLTPHHQYPSTAVLGAPRRLQLIALARQHRFALIEDDYDHEFHYEGRPILPLAARAPESVAYVGTLSKVLAPGLRLGWLVAPSPLREAIIARRSVVDRQGDLVLEEALAELLDEGEVARHVLRMRGLYEQRRDFTVERLRETFGETLSF